MQQFLYNQPQNKLVRRKLRRDQTEAEGMIWNILRNRQVLGLKFYRQYSVGEYILDFFCPESRLGIEIDGGQHNETRTRKHDAVRTKYLRDLDITVLRFWNNEVSSNPEGVFERIIEEIEAIK